MRFNLIHKVTGLTLGEYKSRNTLRYYSSNLFRLNEDDDFRNLPIKAVIRCDGRIGFQRLNPGYDRGELYWLPYEEWEIVVRPGKVSVANMGDADSDDAADRAADGHSGS